MSKTDIDATDVARRVVAADTADLFVLDVRNEGDYGEWRIPGSTNVPVYDELLSHDYSGLAEHADDLPDDTEIAVVCVGGVTSARAAEFLRGRGYDAKSIPDGMRAWGRVHREYEVGGVDGVVQFVRPGTGCVSYLAHDGGEAVVVDPSQYVDRYLDAAADRDLEIVGVADTHAHADHVSGARRLAGELDVPYYLHAEDAGALDGITEIADGDGIAVGNRRLDVLFTPGHTPGSISFRFGDAAEPRRGSTDNRDATRSGPALLSGDTLFLRSVGRPDLEDSSEDAVREAASRLFDSLDELTDLPDDTVVLPGHFGDEGSRPLATELGELRAETTNELLSYVADDDEGAFVETVVGGRSAEPANYNEIKRINWGKAQPGGDVESLELGPNNCAAN